MTTFKAWSSTILTMSLVIPAIIQKKQAALTLYHATLVLNFATFSSVSSLAVVGFPSQIEWVALLNRRCRCPFVRFGGTSTTQITLYLMPLFQLFNNQIRQRRRMPGLWKPPLNLSGVVHELYYLLRWLLRFAPTCIYHHPGMPINLTLFSQVSFQWGWAAYLFVSPYYAQTACNPFTMVVLFGVSKTALEINRGLFGLWASWLLFSILVTLLFGILLVNSCTSGVNAKVQSRKQLRQPKKFFLRERVRAWDKSGDKRRRIIFATAFVICLLLVAFSETQVKQNCVFNENTQWGFGQVSLCYLYDVVWADGNCSWLLCSLR